MKPTKTEKEIIRKQFDVLARFIIRCVAYNSYRVSKRDREHQTLFTDLSYAQMNSLYTVDIHYEDRILFNVVGEAYTVQNGYLAELLLSLPDKKRDIILLYYFGGYNDREIGERMGLAGSNVCHHRHAGLEKLHAVIDKGEI